jgi:hypothetical protein
MCPAMFNFALQPPENLLHFHGSGMFTNFNGAGTEGQAIRTSLSKCLNDNGL